MKYVKRKTITLIILALLIISATVYNTAVPYVISNEYVAKVHSASLPLVDNFKDLDKSTDFYVLNDPDVTTTVKKNEMAHVSELVSVSRQEINVLKEVKDSLVPLPYSNLAGQYEKALVIREQSQRFIDQSEDALAGYLVLVAYLESFDQITDDVALELDKFNKVSDVNIYESQSESMRRIADKMRKDADTLAKLPHPNEMDPLNVAAIAAINKAASGFDGLANGLSIPADDPIYAAAREIESASTEIDAVTGESYDKSLEQSRAIKNIQDLSEKLELVLGVQEF